MSAANARWPVRAIAEGDGAGVASHCGRKRGRAEKYCEIFPHRQLLPNLLVEKRPDQTQSIFSTS
jgi:hypothetical protein